MLVYERAKLNVMAGWVACVFIGLISFLAVEETTKVAAAATCLPRSILRHALDFDPCRATSSCADGNDDSCEDFTNEVGEVEAICKCDRNTYHCYAASYPPKNALDDDRCRSTRSCPKGDDASCEDYKNKDGEVEAVCRCNRDTYKCYESPPQQWIQDPSELDEDPCPKLATCLDGEDTSCKDYLNKNGNIETICLCNKDTRECYEYSPEYEISDETGSDEDPCPIIATCTDGKDTSCEDYKNEDGNVEVICLCNKDTSECYDSSPKGGILDDEELTEDPCSIIATCKDGKDYSCEDYKNEDGFVVAVCLCDKATRKCYNSSPEH